MVLVVGVGPSRDRQGILGVVSVGDGGVVDHDGSGQVAADIVQSLHVAFGVDDARLLCQLNGYLPAIEGRDAGTRVDEAKDSFGVLGLGGREDHDAPQTSQAQQEFIEVWPFVEIEALSFELLSNSGSALRTVRGSPCLGSSARHRWCGPRSRPGRGR